MKRFVWVLLVVGLLMCVSIAAAAGGGGFAVGEAVYAEWTPNNWYHGKIDKQCNAGWHIAFDDGDQKCCIPGQIVKDVVPDASKVKIGADVLAQWQNNRFYPGAVAAIAGGTYTINFEDGDKGTVKLNQIRLR